MAQPNEYLTTKELAELLRIKERKVYDLAASGKVPCSRATGKLLFARTQINAWLADSSSGFSVTAAKPRASIFLGSHDPLLEWALMESRSGLASFFDSSFDGLERYQDHEGIATGLHIYDAASKQWNVPIIAERFCHEPAVLVEWAWRNRGLIVAAGTRDKFKDITSLVGKRFVPRQAEAGSQQLFNHLLAIARITSDQLELIPAARGETYAAQAVQEGKADAAFGLEALAGQYQLDFIPLTKERFDLLVDRHFWFEQPMQKLLSFCAQKPFHTRAAELGGYNVSNLGHVHFNGR